MSKTNTGVLPVITVPETMFTTESHEKYGESFSVSNNNVMFNGKLCKVYSYNTFEKIIYDGREISVKVTKLSFKPVKGASEPKAAEVKPSKVFKTAEVKKVPVEVDRVGALEAKLDALMNLLAAKA
jgi:hypothetical protein